jgi:hypothetical protein
MQLVWTKWPSRTTCHFENIWRKSKSCGHAHLHYVYKHPTKYYSCSSKTVGGDSRTNHVSISGRRKINMPPTPPGGIKTCGRLQYDSIFILELVALLRNVSMVYTFPNVNCCFKHFWCFVLFQLYLFIFTLSCICIVCFPDWIAANLLINTFYNFFTKFNTEINTLNKMTWMPTPFWCNQ